MRDDFCAFVLSHGRPDDVPTVTSLRRSGYSGRFYIVVDDEDDTLPLYRARFGDRVLVFSKDAVAAEYDQGDNFRDRRSVFFARNACWSLAEAVGCRYFVELDDDYTSFLYRLVGTRAKDTRPRLHGWTIENIDRVFEAMIGFLDATGAASVAMSQGGDHIGGNADVKFPRKAMNSFVCDATRPFPFLGRINEDVSTYVTLGNRGSLFFTYWPLQLNQNTTQRHAGGMTELYLDAGTYVKSFYSVMYAPSCVTVVRSASMRRLHHSILWPSAVPKIVAERWRREPADATS